MQLLWGKCVAVLRCFVYKRFLLFCASGIKVCTLGEGVYRLNVATMGKGCGRFVFLCATATFKPEASSYWPFKWAIPFDVLQMNSL